MGACGSVRVAVLGAALAIAGLPLNGLGQAAPVAGSVAGTAASSSEVLAGHASARSTAVRVTGRWARAVDTRSRAEVNASYWRGYDSVADVPTGFTGDDATCRAGSTTVRSRAATLRAVNYMRSLGGLAPVKLSATLNARAQRTALMMSANRSLSHRPPSSWRCWTRTGAANAGRSNLALSYPAVTSGGVVGLYMEELGAGNRAVGHRRWLMNPFATTMGTGATDTANALTVIGPTARNRPNPAWVSWPTAGYFPSTLEPAGRWSLSAGNPAMSFRYAKVRVWRNGTPVRVVKNPVATGYAQPTVSWELPDQAARSGRFKVVVSGIRRAGHEKAWTRTYGVTMFAPTR